MEQPEVRMKTLDDVGTRYQHLKDLADSWEATIAIITERKPVNTPEQRQKLAKICIAYEILNITIDSFAEYHDPDKQYTLYRTIESVPMLPVELTGGTTECKSS